MPFIHAQVIEEFEFERFSIEDGLSAYAITFLFQDSHGFIWVGTQEGLNRFDGYHFKSYRADPQNPYSISNDYVRAIYEDDQGILWIGTTEGLNRYDRKTDRFTRFMAGEKGLVNDVIYDVEPSSLDGLWVATESGIVHFETGEERFVLYDQNILADTLTYKTITTLIEDQEGWLWVGTPNGLNAIELTTKSVRHFTKNAQDETGLSGNFVHELYMDRSEVLWAGTDQGLCRYDRNRGQFIPYATSQLTNIANAVLQDRNGALWVGTWGEGLYKLHPFGREASPFSHIPDDEKSLSNDKIYGLLEDRAGNVWVATLNGLNKIIRPETSFRSLRRQRGVPNTLSYNHISSLTETNDGSIWIGTWGGGLNQWDRKSGNMTKFRQGRGANALQSDQLLAVHEDPTGALWVGSDGGGLSKYMPESNDFVHYFGEYSVANGSLAAPERIYSIYQAKEGEFWLNTMESGLMKFNTEAATFERFQPPVEDSTVVRSVRSIYCVDRSQPGYVDRLLF